MARNLYGIHDWSPVWGRWVKDAGVTAWCITTHEMGETYNEFGAMAQYGVTPIARLNWSHHGKGTIPKHPDQDASFARWCTTFVVDSPECQRFIIGNEPNIAVEGAFTVKRYVNVYKMVYAAIKKARPDAVVIPAAIGPWNVESGIGWVEYFREMLMRLGDEYDALALHTYSRGYKSQDVYSDAKMDPPWNMYYSGFLAYRDFLAVVPVEQRHKPVYITEANGNEPWPNATTGWPQAAYWEIARWNRWAERYVYDSAQSIQCLALFRWPKFDQQWEFETKPGVHQDFKHVLSERYPAPDFTLFLPSISSPGTPPVTPPEFEQFGVSVVADVLNIRLGPGVEHEIVGTLYYGDRLTVLEQSGDWYRYFGGWVHSGWVKPVVADQTDWQRIYAWIRRWEGGWADHPRDKGGPTMAGITLATYTRWRAKHGLPAPTVEDLRNISEEDIEAIYKAFYWEESGADAMEWPLNFAQMNTAVLGGVGRAREMLSRSGGDFSAYNGHVIDWFSRLEDFDVFGRAWMRRQADLLIESSRM